MADGRATPHRVRAAWQILRHGIPEPPDEPCAHCGRIYDDQVHICERCAAQLGVRWEGRGSIEPETGREIEP